MYIAIVTLLMWGVGDGDVRLHDMKFQSRDITALVQPAMRGLTVAAKAAVPVSKSPDGPITGWVTWGVGPKDAPRKVTLALRETPGEKPIVWADADGDGDLTNDPPVSVEAVAMPGGNMQFYRGQFSIRVAQVSDAPLSIKFHRFSAAEAIRRKIAADAFYCYPDYGWTGKLLVGERQYPILLTDGQATADFTFTPDQAAESNGVTLFVDANRNGTFESMERFRASETISLDDAAVVVEKISADGREITLARAGVHEPRIRPATVAKLEPGGKALGFEAKAVDGGTIKLLHDFKGKLVLLDFWATWCGPCVAEIPAVVKAYEKYHNNGLDVLGVSLDRPGPGAAERLVKFLNDRKMLWRQIFPGNDVANQWSVSSIPHMYLIDGDTGEILASGGDLRGGRLDAAIEAAMKKKFAGVKEDKK